MTEAQFEEVVPDLKKQTEPITVLLQQGKTMMNMNYLCVRVSHNNRLINYLFACLLVWLCQLLF
jgi:hypothetical protein